MRVGVREAGTGRRGSVFFDLDVPDFDKGGLQMSGLLLNAPSLERYVTVQHDPLVSKLLTTSATSQRNFLQSDVINLYAEIYDNLPLDIAHRIDVRVRLISENGIDAYSARDTLTNGGAERLKSFGLSRQIPLKGLPPGRYLLRVEAESREKRDDNASAETLIHVIGS